MDRRKFIIGTGAAVVATQIPYSVEAAVEAIKPVVPLDQSLLFYKNTGDIGFMLKSNYIMNPNLYYEANTGIMSASAQAKFNAKREDPDCKPKEMAYSIKKYTSDNTLNFNDADDLDQYYFSKCNVRIVDDFLIDKRMKANLFEVERAANQIAKDTLTGKGNSIILSPKNANHFEALTDPDDGYLFGRIRVFIKPWVKDNEILVFYRSYSSQWDVAGLVFDDGGIALNNDFKYAQKIVFKV